MNRPIRSPFRIARPLPKLSRPKENILGENLGELFNLVQQLNDLKSALYDEYQTLQDKKELLDDHIKKVIQLVDQVKQIKKGDPGKPADNDYIVAKILELLPPPAKNEAPVDEEAMLGRFLSKVKPVDQDKLVKKLAKRLKQKPIDKSEIVAEVMQVMGATPVEYAKILEDLFNGKTLKLQQIDGLEQTIASMWSQIGKRGYLHGGGGGGGSSGTAVYSEVPSGLVNGSNASYVLAHTPLAGSLRVYVNGQRMKAGGVDYTLAGTTITFVTAPPTTSILLADYNY